MIQHINKTYDKWLPQSYNTIIDWVIYIFKGEKIHVKTSLYLTKSKIYIIYNLWTSPNSLAILGITA